jgi:hypothetical protein
MVIIFAREGRIQTLVVVYKAMKNKIGMVANGYIALTSVLVVSFVSVGIVLTATLITIDNARNSLDLTNSNKTYYLAQSCIEDSLLRIKRGVFDNFSIQSADGNCLVEISQTEDQFTVVSTAHLNVANSSYTKILEAGLRKSEKSVNLLYLKEI